MNARNASRELRRATARRNALANEIAEAVSSWQTVPPESIVAWRLATMRLYALQNNLRPRECGVALGDGNKQAAPLRGEVSSHLNRAPDNAAPNPASFPNTNHNPTP